MNIHKITEVLVKILMEIPIFFISFFLIIGKGILLNKELTIIDLFTFIYIDVLTFSSYFVVIYLSKSNILLQVLHLIPYIFLTRLNFALVEGILRRWNHGNYNLTSDNKIVIFDFTICILLFVVNIIFIILEKTKKDLFDKLKSKFRF